MRSIPWFVLALVVFAVATEPFSGNSRLSDDPDQGLENADSVAWITFLKISSPKQGDARGLVKWETWPSTVDIFQDPPIKPQYSGVKPRAWALSMLPKGEDHKKTSITPQMSNIPPKGYRFQRGGV
jgi:hypothetical protein